MKTTKLLIGLTLVISALTGHAQPTPSVMKTGQRFIIQSAMNKGKDLGGFWDIPGHPKLIEKGANIQVWEFDGSDDRYYTLVESPEKGYYEIHVTSSPNSRVDVAGGKTKDGTNVGVWEKNNAKAQRFLFHHLGKGRFKIYDRNGKIVCLAGKSNKNGSNVHVWGDHDGAWTEWFLIDPTGGGKIFIPTETQQVTEVKIKGTAVPEGKDFYIQSAMSYGRNNNGFWDLPGTSGAAQNANIQIWSIDGGTDRYFRFEKKRNSEFYQIYAGKTSDGVVDLPSAKTENGNVMQIWKVNEGKGQDFYLKHLGNGRFKIYHRSGKIINLKNTDNKNGNNVQIWNDHDGIHCEWYLVDPTTKKAYIPGNQPVSTSQNEAKPAKPESKPKPSTDTRSLEDILRSGQETSIESYFKTISDDVLVENENGAIVKVLNSLGAQEQVSHTTFILNGLKKNTYNAARNFTYKQLLNVEYKKVPFLYKAMITSYFSKYEEKEPSFKTMVDEIQSKMLK